MGIEGAQLVAANETIAELRELQREDSAKRVFLAIDSAFGDVTELEEQIKLVANAQIGGVIFGRGLFAEGCDPVKLVEQAHRHGIKYVYVNAKYDEAISHNTQPITSDIIRKKLEKLRNSADHNARQPEFVSGTALADIGSLAIKSVVVLHTVDSRVSRRRCQAYFGGTPEETIQRHLNIAYPLGVRAISMATKDVPALRHHGNPQYRNILVFGDGNRLHSDKKYLDHPHTVPARVTVIKPNRPIEADILVAGRTVTLSPHRERSLEQFIASLPPLPLVKAA